MEFEDEQELLKELINLGYSNEISLKASRKCLNLKEALNYIDKKSSTFPDQQKNFPKDTSIKPDKVCKLKNINKPNLSKNITSADFALNPIPKIEFLPIPNLPLPPLTLPNLPFKPPPNDISPEINSEGIAPKINTEIFVPIDNPEPIMPIYNPEPIVPIDNPKPNVLIYNPEPIVPKDNPEPNVLIDNPESILLIDNPEVYVFNNEEHKSLENEEFYKFMAYCLRVRGQDEETISAICGLCTTKEEVLHNLNIPIFYKSVPFSEIPGHYILPEKDSENIEEINSIDSSSPSIRKQWLLYKGVPENLAYELSVNFQSVNEAFTFLIQEMDLEVSTDHIYIPKTPPAVKDPPPPPPPPPPPAHYNPFPNHHLFDLPQSYFSYNSYRAYQSPIILKQPSESDPVAPEIKSDYFEKLKNFRTVLSDSPEIFINFKLGSVNSSGPQFTRRINKEIKSIESSVPCDSTASIFTLIDEKCMHRIYFLLSGTKDTPYSHGLYLFEVLLPENYPNSPPKVKIATTGNGSINFNPNLYKSGHICLSIINTWGGKPEEQWNPSSSTLLQVMLSIQSLIMDNNIIHKEPGFDNYPSNCPENLTYQNEVKYGNIKYAMIENIKKPPLGFEEVIRNHFKCKKEEILKTVDKWTQEMTYVANIGETFQNLKTNAEINRIGPYKAFSDLYAELYTLLDKL